MNRRDLLKFFGAGAVIAPVIGGVASATQHARLIEEPKVEIAAPPKFRPANPGDLLGGPDKWELTLFMRNPSRHTTIRMDCKAFMGSHQIQVSAIDVTSSILEDTFREAIPTLVADISFTVSGPVQVVMS